MGILNKLCKSIKNCAIRLFDRSSVSEVNERETNSSKQTTEPAELSNVFNDTQDSIGYVDLGLPSGTLWADSDVLEENISDDCSLPTYEQATELIEYCQFEIITMPQENRESIKYSRVIGPNGKFISFRLNEYEEYPFPTVARWCKGGPRQGLQYVLLISEATITIGVASNNALYPSRMVRI